LDDSEKMVKAKAIGNLNVGGVADMKEFKNERFHL
jgi:hypothetical protein